MTWNKNKERIEQLEAALATQVEITLELTRLKKELQAEKEKLQEKVDSIADLIRELGL